ncbi:MAG: bifunctional glutamate N-acetyltransferase/amino-acid acetyltransferase ArgJ [Lentisphaerae bacterium]|nr:bifunctional glutamate N-acetyltransferase/amino-acid acetyltransferase ArgJ [Lentisphaerota bacterium]
MRVVQGGVTAARGFSAAGVSAGIKSKKLDLALVVSDRPATIAGVFTTNRIQGATVKLCRERLAAGTSRGVVVNSGNANACTGLQGQADARQMARLLAEGIGCDERQVLVCSTGTIGIPLPMEKIARGIAAAVPLLAPDGGEIASRAIMTTDTVNKQCAVEESIGGHVVRVGGMAKGAGMIEPHMATLLGFITTDAAVRQDALQACLKRAVDLSFNRVTVDGDQSCNDTILLFANGASGGPMLDAGHPEWPRFVDAVERVCRELAMGIVKDGEGATKFVTVNVRGAASDGDADMAARAISRSLLVKTSWYGGDPNWGRVIDAVGYSGAQVQEEAVEIAYDGLLAFQAGRPVIHSRLSELEAVLRQPSFTLSVDLHLGSGQAVMYTCDCSEAYVKINSEYMT